MPSIALNVIGSVMNKNIKQNLKDLAYNLWGRTENKVKCILLKLRRPNK